MLYRNTIYRNALKLFPALVGLEHFVLLIFVIVGDVVTGFSERIARCSAASANSRHENFSTFMLAICVNHAFPLWPPIRTNALNEMPT